MDEKKLGRPARNVDPSGTLGLFDALSHDITDSYDLLSDEIVEDTRALQGPVGGGGVSENVSGGGAAGAVPEYSDAAALRLLWELAHDSTVPAAARIQAAVKHGQEMARLSGSDQAEDIPAELAAFIELLRDKTPEECDKLV